MPLFLNPLNPDTSFGVRPYTRGVFAPVYPGVCSQGLYTQGKSFEGCLFQLYKSINNY
jgi:hypothetical protein